MNLTVKNSKMCQGRDGVAWSCDLYEDGRKVATATNAGTGGNTTFWWTDPARDRARLEAYAKTVPHPPGYEELEMDLETLVAHLADEYQTAKRLRRLCKTKTVYRTATTPADKWHVLGAPFTPALREALVARGATVFANEMVDK